MDGQGGVCATQAESLYMSTLTDAYNSCDQLLDRLKQLENKLSPVCESIPPALAENCGKDSCARPDVIIAIEGLRSKVIIGTDAVNSILDRLVI